MGGKFHMTRANKKKLKQLRKKTHADEAAASTREHVVVLNIILIPIKCMQASVIWSYYKSISTEKLRGKKEKNNNLANVIQKHLQKLWAEWSMLDDSLTSFS